VSGYADPSSAPSTGRSVRGSCCSRGSNNALSPHCTLCGSLARIRRCAPPRVGPVRRRSPTAPSGWAEAVGAVAVEIQRPGILQIRGAHRLTEALDKAVCLDLPGSRTMCLPTATARVPVGNLALISNGRFKVNALSEAREGVGNGKPV